MWTRTSWRSLSIGRPAGRRATIERPWALLLAAWAVTTAILAAGRALTALMDRPLSMLLRDPVAVIGEGECAGAQCVLAGAISNIGIVLWLLTVWVCLHARHRVAECPWRQMLLWGGLLTAVLGLDDLLMIHERLPGLLPSGELLLYCGYAAAGIGFVVSSRRLLLETHVEALMAALCLFASSVLVDAFGNNAYTLEDVPKFFGVVTWATFFWGTARALTRAPLVVRQ